MTHVYVLSKSGKPLMPTRPARARHLPKAGEARVVKVTLFTIQLTIDTPETVQPVYAGQDPGLTQGVAAVSEDGEVLFQAEVKCRPDISEKLAERRNYRRSRRYRKTRYRQPRFANRRRPEGWVAPSIRQLKHEHDKLRRLVESILPVTDWAIELNKFDFQKMENPDIQGVQYQNGPQKGYFDVREYVLERDGYACVLCESNVNRKLYHFRGKSDRPKNLVTFCGECHKKAVDKEIPFEVLLESYRWAAEDGYEYLMALEAQTRIDRDMPRRLLEYTALQHREFKKPVYPVVLNLTGRPQTDTYSFDCLDLTVIAFSYRLINLVDLPGEEVLKHGPVGIIPLVPLMRHQLPDEEVLAECARRIEEAPAEWQPDLYFGLALFSSLRYTREIILKIIEVSKMETSPLFDGIREKWIDQGEQRGLQKGLQQGSREERIKAIMEALEENTGCYPEDLGDRLRAIQDMDILKALFRRAVKAKSLEEFTSALNEIAKLNN